MKTKQKILFFLLFLPLALGLPITAQHCEFSEPYASTETPASITTSIDSSYTEYRNLYEDSSYIEDIDLYEDTSYAVGDATDAPYLKLASWNIRIFSKNRTDDELKKICKVAQKFDFIGIIELRDSTIMDRMVAMLKSQYGKNYRYEFSPAVGAGVKEYYAFLYDTSRVRLLTSGKIYQDSTFLRCPYYATFKAGQFDFTVIIIHVIWGNTVGEQRKEIQRLATVYQNIQDSDPKENDIILMGDFNRNPDDDLAWGPLRSIHSMNVLFALPASSMIWDTNLYYNMMFQSVYTSEYTLDKGIVRFDETYFGNDDNAANKAVSDQRPIWAQFRTDYDDD